MSLPDVESALKGDISDFQKKMAQARQDMKTTEQHAEAGGGAVRDHISVGFSKGAAAAVAAGTLIADAVKSIASSLISIGRESIQAALDADKGMAQTQAVIKSTAGVAKVSMTDIDNLTNSIKNYAGVDDDVVRSGTNMLLTFTDVRNGVGKGNDIFNQATKVMTDMSVAMGTDMQSQAIQLGKALQDPIGGITALTRAGVNFSEQQKEHIKTLVAHGDVLGAQKIILAELNKEFGGSAKAFGDSSAGAAAKIQNIWGDVQKAVGHGILDVAGLVLPFVTTIGTGVLDFFTKIEGAVKMFTDGLASGKEPLAAFYDTIETVFGEDVKNTVAGFGNIIMSVVDALSPLRDAFGSVVDIIGQLMPSFSVTRNTADDMAGAFDAVHAAAQLVADGLRFVAAHIPGLKAALEPLHGAFSSVVQIVGSLFAGGMDLVKWIVSLLPKMEDGKKGGQELGGAFDVVHTASTAVAGVLKFVADHMDLVKLVLTPLLVMLATYQAITTAAAVVTWVQTTAVGAWTAAQAALNLVLSMNPIGLVVLAIAALVAGAIFAYTHFKGFHDAVDGVFGVLKGVAGFIGDHVVPVIANLGGLYIKALVLEFNLVAAAVGWFWDHTKGVRDFLLSQFSPALEGLKILVKGVGGYFGDMATDVKKVWDGFVGFIRFLTDHVTPVLDGIAKTAKTVGDALSLLDPTKKKSPSLVDHVAEGIGQIRDLYGSLAGLTIPRPSLTGGDSGGINGGVGAAAMPAFARAGGGDLHVHVQVMGNVLSPEGLAESLADPIREALLRRARSLPNLGLA